MNLSPHTSHTSHPPHTQRTFLIFSASPKLGKLKEAMASIEKSLKVKPTHVNGIYNKGYCYGLMGREKLAIEFIAKAIKLNPKKYLPVAKTDPNFAKLRKNSKMRSLLLRGRL